MELSIVIPLCNEAENAQSLCEELRRCLAGRVAHEVLLVDDGSIDGTFEVLSRLRDEIAGLRVLRHSRNAGQSAALATGVRAARAGWVATLDGDGQNDPADLLKLWQLASTERSPAGLYIGHRVARHDNWVRIASSRIANAVRSRLLHDRVPDTGCGVKLFRRELFLSLPYFDHMHRFLPALVQREGLRVASVPVSHRPRLAGRSKYGVGNRLFAGMVDMAGVMWLQRRRRRAGLIAETGSDEL
jgi:dolichol-phosphate mannosyltransferase